MFQILTADDETFARRGLRHLLEHASDDWQIVAEATDAGQALVLARIAGPDIAVVDSDLTGDESHQLCRRLSDEGVAVIVYYSGPIEYARPEQVFGTGTLCRVSKSAPLSELTNAVTLLSRAIESHRTTGRRTGTLTRREFQIARLLAAGYRNKTIATKLRLSTRTVEAHRESVRRKLGIDSIGDLARLFAAARAGESPYDLPVTGTANDCRVDSP